MIRESKQYKTTEKWLKKEGSNGRSKEQKGIRYTENKYQNGRRKLFLLINMNAKN